jgi:hypothetical protein
MKYFSLLLLWHANLFQDNVVRIEIQILVLPLAQDWTFRSVIGTVGTWVRYRLNFRIQSYELRIFNYIFTTPALLEARVFLKYRRNIFSFSKRAMLLVELCPLRLKTLCVPLLFLNSGKRSPPGVNKAELIPHIPKGNVLIPGAKLTPESQVLP